MSSHKILGFFKYVYYYFDRIICIFIKKSKEISEKKQIIIIANLGLGDAINFLSVVDKYRAIYSKDNYEITLVVSPGLKKLFENETGFDYIYSKNYNEIVFSLHKRIEFIKFLNEKKYDVLIDIMGPTGWSPSLYLIRCANAKKKITLLNCANSFVPYNILSKTYTDIYKINDNKISNVDYYNKLCNLIMKNTGKYEILFHKTNNYPINLKLPKNYYIIFPSASAEVKKWPLNRYAEIIKRIYLKTKLPLVFCGTEIDLNSVNELIKLIDVPYTNIIGKTDVLEFIQVIKESKFVVTNDTSAYHIAVNEEVPTAIIVGGYTYDSFVLYNFYHNNYKRPYCISKVRKCFNCRSHCKYIGKANLWPCLNDVTVDYAWKIIEKMIDKEVKIDE